MHPQRETHSNKRELVASKNQPDPYILFQTNSMRRDPSIRAELNATGKKSPLISDAKREAIFPDGPQTASEQSSTLWGGSSELIAESQLTQYGYPL